MSSQKPDFVEYLPLDTLIKAPGETFLKEREEAMQAAERTNQERGQSKELQEKNRRLWNYANTFKIISVASLSFVGLMIVLTLVEVDNFNLDSSVLIAMMGVALSIAFVPVYLVAKYLSNNDGQDRKRRDNLLLPVLF